MTPTDRLLYRKPRSLTEEERAAAREPRMTPAECREVVARAIARGTLKPAEAKLTDPKNLCP